MRRWKHCCWSSTTLTGMAAVAHAVAPPHSTHAPLSLMSCVSRGVPSPLGSPHASPHCGRHSAPPAEEDARHESKKRSFHPLRGLRRMFRRKGRSSESSGAAAAPGAGAGDDQAHGDHGAPGVDGATGTANGAPRSSSTGRLLADGPNANDSRRAAGGLYPGLSVSHDSVFTADPSDQSGSDTTSTQSVQRLVLPGVRAELVDALRRRNQRGHAGRGPGRGDTSEEDEDLGLPRSPCNSALQDRAEHPAAKDQSTCSDGSLLSMGSSDLDEDSCGQSSSRHSSKLSLQDKRSASADGDLEVSVITTPLSHSAARHKMAVKPKRTHGAPRRKRIQQLSAPALPATPELNEEPSGSGRSLSPELPPLPPLPDAASRLALADAAAATAAATTTTAATTTGPTPAPRTLATPGYQLKSASLPPGAALQRGPSYALPGLGAGLPGAASAKASGVVTVTRSRSSAASRQEHEQGREHGAAGFARRSGSSDQLDRHERHDQQDSKAKQDLSFFSRLLSRRSGKKKKGERATEQPPAPVLPPSAAAATSAPAAANAYYSVYAAKEEDAAACSLPTRRLDEKGRYVADAEVAPPAVPAVVPPGGLTSHFLSGANARARQRLEPMTLPPNGLAGDVDAVDAAAAPRTTTPLDGVPNPVKPEPAVAPALASGRMQVSYSTSPPAPLWPAGETKVVELIEKSPEARSQFEQEKEREGKLRGTRIPGLSAFQQRVALVGDEVVRDASLGDDAVRLRRPVAGRADSQPPSLPAGLGLGFGLAKEREALRHLDDEMSAISLTASEGEAFSGAPDSLEPTASADKAGHTTTPGHAPAPVLPAAQQKQQQQQQQQQDAPPRPRAPSSDALNPSAARQASPRRQAEQAIGAKGKSSSIESLGPTSPPPPPLLPKAASSDSITAMHQVTIPLGSGGVSITHSSISQRGAAEAGVAAPAAAPVLVAVAAEEQHCVTVACVPDPVPATTPTPSPASTQPPHSGAPAVTLVNLPSPTAPAPTATLTASSVESLDSPTDADRPVEADKPADKLGDKPGDEPADRPEKTDKTEKSDLPAESGPTELATVLRPSALLRKSLPPMPLAAEEPAKGAQAAKVPEFMRVQLNRVDSKPSVNVVLSTSPERGGRGSIGSLDPWAVEEVMVDAPLPVSMLGLRAKRSSSKDDLAPALALGAASPPASPLSASPPKSLGRSVAAVAPRPAAVVAPQMVPQVAPQVAPQVLGRKPQGQPPLAKRPPCLSEDNNNVIIVEKKDLKKAAEAQQQAQPVQPADASPPPIGRRTASRDSLHWQSSAEDKEKDKSRDSSVSPVLDGVVLRRKSLPREALAKEGQDRGRDDTPELMKVFARRSLKVRDSEAELSLPPLQSSVQASRDSSVPVVEQASPPQQRANRDSDKENEGESPESPAASPKEERTATMSPSARFQRSLSQPSQQEPASRPLPLGEKPAKPAKPTAALDHIIKDNNSNRLRVRKPDNVLANGGGNLNNNNNNNNILNSSPDKTAAAVAPPSSVVAKISARWTLPAETKAAPGVVSPPAAAPSIADAPAVAADDVPEENANNAVPKFKRIQQRREEWEQRAKQSKSLQRAAQ